MKYMIIWSCVFILNTSSCPHRAHDSLQNFSVIDLILKSTTLLWQNIFSHMLVVDLNIPQTFILPLSSSRDTPQHHSGIPKNIMMIIVMGSKNNDDVQDNEIMFSDRAALVSLSLIYFNFSFQFCIIPLSSR